MTEALVPESEAALAEAVRLAEGPLLVEGSGTAQGMLRPVQAERVLSTRRLTGVTLHRPQELVISVRAGTTLPAVEAAAAEHGQVLAPEPPDLRALLGTEDRPPPTIGGLVSSNLSGPRRIAGFALRDVVLGLRFVNGEGEVLRTGGRVHKNVTGLDLGKLLAGSHGTLAVITEVTLKLLPRPERAASLLLRVPDLRAGVAALSAGLGSPYRVSGAAVLPGGWGGLAGPVAALRLEETGAAVSRRLPLLAAAVGGGEALEGEASEALWRAVRDARPLAPVAGEPAEEEAVWRLSVRPSLGAGAAEALGRAFGARALLDWGGGLVWVAGPATEAAHAAVAAEAARAGGVHWLCRAPPGLRASVAVVPGEAPALAAIAARVKAAFDPRGVLNPGRVRAGG